MKMHTHKHTHTPHYEAAQPSAAHAWLLSWGHADCMSYSGISMLQAWSCVDTTLLSLPSSTSLLCLPLTSLSYLPSLSLSSLGSCTSLFPSFRVKQSQILEQLLLQSCCLFTSLLFFFWASLSLNCLWYAHTIPLPPSPRPCLIASCASEFLGPIGEQHAWLIIPLGSSHIG